MILNSEKVLELMKKKGVTMEILQCCLGINCISNNCFIAPCKARRLARALKVEVSEIILKEF